MRSPLPITKQGRKTVAYKFVLPFMASNTFHFTLALWYKDDNGS